MSKSTIKYRRRIVRRKASTENIVQATGVAKSYRNQGIEIPALVDINLTIQRGEVVAIMGASGSGKSTLLNCLAGLDIIDAGQICIAGQDIAELNDEQRTDFRATHMGFIFQNFNLLPILNAVENVELPLLITRHAAPEARKRALVWLNRVGLSAFERRRPMQLSGGQRQRLAIARALVNEPAIVWADEPTGALDSETANDIMDLFLKLNHELSQTLVIVTHANEIAARADRILYIHDGRIKEQETGK
jgi:ABC-type lipoprotein export system ATPase subunit